ncbi:MAG TPA: DmsE family decaheme c-type cytochrome [Candidatus Acidoferrales bacterium]|jgi:DmsE family decaheme c-type cytochrome|nr:DmsE family decaheme c-type cytochrome [Candidatus Acidoferrales bacterium]
MGCWKTFRWVTIGWVTIAALVLFCMQQVPTRAQEGPTPKTSPAAAATPAPAPAPDTKDSAAGEYVGSEVCKTCHEDIYDSWEKTPHWKTMLDTRGGPSHQGCEGCHGPGSAHVAAGGDVTKIFVFKNHSAKEIDDRCLTCHAGGTEHMNTINSIHARSDVSCTSCHSPHHAESREFLLVKSQPELCYGCHLTQKAQFEMPFHHRVNEGLIECSDCHNVHGTEGPKQVRMAATQDEVCFKCHTDKQGPFVYEHAPVKVDGCESCHMVHGGPNAHMLKVSNVNLLCLQCHTTSSFSNAPAPLGPAHDQATFFQACTLCHSQIHGSNFSATFFK